jgi:hypothetical protein
MHWKKCPFYTQSAVYLGADRWPPSKGGQRLAWPRVFPIGDIHGKQLGKQKFSPKYKSILLAALLLEHLVTVIIYDSTATTYSANIDYFTKFL